MSLFDVRKIRKLLSADTESVHQAFELWLTFCTDGESFVKELPKVLHLLPSKFHPLINPYEEQQCSIV